MKVSTENDNHFGYEKITIVVDNMPLINIRTMPNKKKVKSTLDDTTAACLNRHMERGHNLKKRRLQNFTHLYT